MADNRTIIHQEFEKHKGELVIHDFRVYQLVGVAEDIQDFYWMLFDGRNITRHTCVGMWIPLKGHITGKDYADMMRICVLNYHSSYNLWGTLDKTTPLKEQIDHFRRENERYWSEYKKDTKDTKIIVGIFWELN